ncbi:long-chain-fatty-acid--CoA ligase [Alkalihalobacterium elongatum]|uniref:long-chain-fatty-acid--CoA ligase n=1 Tax=Alkalihalobacterium elongatum TaxID=2675466 RepID=UPI001C1F290A|nr:long-chain-fatty-acid--CoA ligase [Alkalihalobacterium elongatum]
MTLNLALQNIAKEHGNKIAYHFEGQEETYGVLNKKVNSFASSLKETGIQKGDHIALIMGNAPEFMYALYGAWHIGAVVIPINPTYTKTELQYLLENGNVKAVISIPQLLPVIEELKSELKELTYILDVTSEEFNRFVQSGDQNFAGVPIDENENAVILYTSGTTGKPKGAMLTHKNLYTNAVATGNALHITEDDVIINALPMFHIFAMTVCLNMPIVKGTKVIIMRQFSPKEFLRLVKEHKVTFFGGVPTMYNFIYHFLQENPEGFSSVTHCASGGASLPLAILDKFKNEFGVLIQEGFGISEGAGVVTVNPRYGVIKEGSVGVPIEDIQVKVVDNQGNEVERGKVGELICKGPNVFKGYYQMPEKTASDLRDGWLYTGDFAKMDEDGYVYIVDRKKDLIIVGGYNVYPREVEEVLFKHELIVETGVVGAPDEEYGEKVVAYVVLKDNISEAELLEYCRQHLAAYKVPAEIIICENELPKTSSGKILRRALRDQVTT